MHFNAFYVCNSLLSLLRTEMSLTTDSHKKQAWEGNSGCAMTKSVWIMSLTIY